MSEQRPVALGIQGPFGGGGQTADPLHTFSEVANIQNALNQNRLFQMQMQGRQRFGEIMAGGGSLEDRFTTAMQDPIASAFAPQLINEMRQANLALTQTHEVGQRMALSGMESVTHGISALMNNPDMTQDQFHQMQAARMSVLSPEAQRANAFAMGSMETYLYDGLPDDPAARTQEIQKRGAGLLTSVGVTPENIRGMLGQLPPTIQRYTGPGGEERFAVIGGQPLGMPTTTAPIGGAPQGGIPTGAPVTTGVPAGGPAPAGAPATVNPAGQPLLPGESAIAPPQPPAPTQMVGPTTEQTRQREKAAEADGKVMDDMAAYNPRGDMLAAARANAVLDAIQKVKTGGFTAMGMEAGRWVTGFGRIMGWDPKTTEGIANQFAGGNLSEAQMLRHLLGNQAIQALKDAMTGTGRVMRPEVDAAMQNLNVDMQPEAIWHLLNDQVMPLVQQSYDMGAKWPQYRQAVLEGRMGGLRIGDYPTWSLTRVSRDQRVQTTPDGIRLGRRGVEEMPNWSVSAPETRPTPTPRPAPAAPPAGGLPPLTPPDLGPAGR